MKTKQDYLNLLEETVTHYKTHPRSHDGPNGCLYVDRNHNTNCAVGRCLTSDALEAIVENKLNNAGLSTMVNTMGTSLDELLKKKYEGFHQGFWSQLQVLHDTDSFWNEASIHASEREISKRGLIYVDQIIEDINKRFI